ncbi:MAG: hypothetical protein U0939_18315 [Pirellulales bacterium]
MSSPNLHVAADDRIARETAPGSARRFLTQSLCAVVMLPLGMMAAVSVVRELAASREPVSGGEYIATARWSPMETDGESLTRGANRLSAELASPELSPLRVEVVEGQAASPVWKLARCRCASR